MRIKCVVVADGARARLFLSSAEAGSGAAFREVESIAAPGMRGHLELGPTDAKALSEPRAVLRDELRQQLVRELHIAMRRMANEYGATELLLVAPPRMLGLIRSGWAPTDWGFVSVHTLAKDYTRLSLPALQDALAGEGLATPRPRRLPAHVGA